MGSMSTQTITEFLEARIAEDEKAAKAWSATLTDDLPIPAALLGGIVNPSRSLAECAAKRAIIEEHAPVKDEGWISGKDHDYLFCGACGTLDDAPVPYPCATLMILAAVYADHADYQQEWKL